MKFKAVQWNIGGSLIRDESDDPTERSSYATEDVGYIVDQLGVYDADVVTLQEAHSDDEGAQAEEIAGELGYQTCINHSYAPSHLVDGQWLSQAVLSRYPVIDQEPKTEGEPMLEPESFTTLRHRDWQARQKSGEVWRWMNKGISVVKLALADDAELSVATLHFPVFERLGVALDTQEAQSVLREAQGIIAKTVGNLALLQGDFNIDDTNMRWHLHNLFVCGFGQHIQIVPTTPKGQRFDHVLFRGARCLESVTDPTVLTDHYPLITELEVAQDG